MKAIILFIGSLVGILILLFTTNAFGQISQGGIPYSLQISSDEAITYERKDILSREIPTIEMPVISRSTIEELKANNNKEQTPYQFAYSFDVNIDLKKSAIKDSIECGFLYRLAIKSSEAYSINVIFSEYRVPPGAKLFMYNEIQDYLLGAYTSNNNQDDGIFAISPVIGEKIILEYFEPYFSDFSGSLIISRVSHDFLDILNSGEKSELRAAGSCQVDINCSEGNGWQVEKRAVCRILIDGNGLCSGSLINNTNNNGQAYFLTANHCVSTQQKASSCIFYFNYEKPSCGSGSGSLSQSISGANLRATGFDSDFTLLELSKMPLSTFRPYFAGWDRNNAQSAGGVGIHHPAGDVKKISTFNVVPPNSINCFNDRPNANFYRINWIATANGHGVTEGGSSGSPLFNSNRRIIGQLYGAGLVANCPNPNCSDPANDNSNYGKIFSSWNLGTTSGGRLRDWLDPSNTTFILDGIDACPTGTVVNLNLNNTISSGTYQATNNIESTGIVQSGANVEYNAGNRITLKPGFHAQAGSQFHAKIGNFNCVVVPDPINLVAWTNVACIGTGLQFNITNAANYTVKIYTVAGSLVYSGSGNISGNSVTVWSATGVSIGYYIANISFSSSASGEVISNSYTILVTSCAKSASTSTSENSEILLTIQEIANNLETGNNKFDFIVFPNPNDGNFTIQLIDAEEMKPFSIHIFSSSGAIISQIEHCNTNQLNFNHTGLPPGVYYVRLSMGINIVTKKIIIQ